MRKCLAVMLLSGMVLLGGCLSGGGGGSGDGSAEVEAAIEAYRGLITTRGCDESVGNGGVGGDIVFEAGAELKLLNEGVVATVVPTDFGKNPARVTEDMEVKVLKYGSREPEVGIPYFVEDEDGNIFLHASRGLVVSDASLATGLEIAEGATATFKGNVDKGELVLILPGGVVINGTLKTKLTDLSYNGVVITSGNNVVVGPKGCINAVNEGLYPASGITLTCREASLLGGIVTGGKDVNDKVESKSGVQIIANQGSVYLAGLIKVTGSKAGLQVSANGKASSIYCSAGIGTEGGKHKSGNLTFRATKDIVFSGYDEINTSGGKGSASGGEAGKVNFTAGTTLTNAVDINALGGAGKLGGNASILSFAAAQVVNSGQLILDGGAAAGKGGQVELSSDSKATSLSGAYKISVLDGDGRHTVGKITVDGQTPAGAEDGVLP